MSEASCLRTQCHAPAREFGILENLVLDQLIIIIIFFAILIICQLDIVLMLKGEILSWSPMGVKGLKLL